MILNWNRTVAEKGLDTTAAAKSSLVKRVGLKCDGNQCDRLRHLSISQICPPPKKSSILNCIIFVMRQLFLKSPSRFTVEEVKLAPQNQSVVGSDTTCRSPKPDENEGDPETAGGGQ